MSILKPCRPRANASVTAAMLTAISSAGVTAAVAHPVRSPLEASLIVDLPVAEQKLVGKRFSQIRGVSELTDGRVLVSDGLEQSLYVVDFRSGNVGTVGTIEDGPREYRYPGRLYPLGVDSVLVTDQITHRSFLVVGDSIRETLTQVSSLLLELGGEPPWGVDRSGRVLRVQGFGYSGNRLALSRVEADSLRILLTTGNLFSRKPGQHEKIAEVGGQGRLGGWARTQAGHSRYNTSPLSTEGQAWLFYDGWIALAHPEPYRVDWRTPEGEWVRGDPLPFDSVRVTDRQKCFAATGGRIPGACHAGSDDWFIGTVSASFPWPDYVPPFVMARHQRTNPGGIAVQPAPNGMVLIQRTPLAEPPGKRYDVVDRTGSLRGAIRLQENQTIVGIGSSVLYVATEESATLTLSRHSWPEHLGGRQ
ncbi:MAG: hypothetical protein OXI71_08865 [Gemmatimonadota bacterium]|nr:hypothetical protein [Gemmatimonadota bacterium]